MSSCNWGAVGKHGLMDRPCGRRRDSISKGDTAGLWRGRCSFLPIWEQQPALQTDMEAMGMRYGEIEG